MDRTYNVFISHHGKDDAKLQRLRQRLHERGYHIRNSSVDSKKHRPVRPSDQVIRRHLRRGISWSGTFICLIGEETHSRPWVNYEIREAHKQGKRIVGIYTYGTKDSVELPLPFKKYGGPALGWNSLDKLADILDGKDFPVETPSGESRQPIYAIHRVKC